MYVCLSLCAYNAPACRRVWLNRGGVILFFGCGSLAAAFCLGVVSSELCRPPLFVRRVFDNAIVVYTKPHNFLNFLKGRPKKERNPTSFRKLKPHHITFNIFQQIWELHNFVSKKMTKPLVTSTISPAEDGTKEFSGVHTWHGVRSWWRAKSLVLQILSIDIRPCIWKNKKNMCMEYYQVRSCIYRYLYTVVYSSDCIHIQYVIVLHIPLYMGTICCWVIGTQSFESEYFSWSRRAWLIMVVPIVQLYIFKKILMLAMLARCWSILLERTQIYKNWIFTLYRCGWNRQPNRCGELQAVATKSTKKGSLYRYPPNLLHYALLS